MKKLMLFSIGLLMLVLVSSCTTSRPENQFEINLQSSTQANEGNNYIVVYEQPSSMDKMAQTTYDSLSKEILNNDHQTKLVHPQDETKTLTFTTKNEPAAIYFVMNKGENYSTWRYYIPNPAGGLWSCIVDNMGDISCKNDDKK